MNALATIHHSPEYAVSDIERMAHSVAKSGLFGIKTQEQAVALMLIAQAEGMHPAIAARDYHVIQGRPTLKADAMLARFHQAGGKVTWNEYTPERVSGTFSHSQGGTVEIEWTIAQAKAANLTNKDTWRQYPRQMLRARVISEGIRTVFPGVAVGVYTPEEAEDFTSPASRAVVETVTTVPADEPAPADWKTLDDEMDACRSVDDLEAWNKRRERDIKALPKARYEALGTKFGDLRQKLPDTTPAKPGAEDFGLNGDDLPEFA